MRWSTVRSLIFAIAELRAVSCTDCLTASSTTTDTEISERHLNTVVFQQVFYSSVQFFFIHYIIIAGRLKGQICDACQRRSVIRPSVVRPLVISQKQGKIDQ